MDKEKNSKALAPIGSEIETFIDKRMSKTILEVDKANRITNE